MSTQIAANQNVSDKIVFVRMVLSAWDSYNARVKKLLDTFSDEQLLAETAPGRNRGIYLIGHLITVSDGLFPILGFGEKLYPELNKIFLEDPDRLTSDIPSVNELREYWDRVNTKLADHIKEMPMDEWFNRHNNVSEADFAKEPHRNKLNIIVNRTNHTSYHLGQLVYLDKKEDQE